MWAGARIAPSLSDGEGWWPRREHSWPERPAAEAGETLNRLGSDPHGLTQLASQIISETGFLVFGDFKKHRSVVRREQGAHSDPHFSFSDVPPWSEVPPQPSRP